MTQTSQAKQRLLERWRTGGAAASNEIVPPRPERAWAPASYAQEALWFLDQMYPGNPIYNMASAVRLLGPLDVRALEEAVTELVARHEALRTRLVGDRGRLRQQIDPPAAVPLERHTPAGPGELHAWLAQLAGTAFALDTGPLIRFGLATLDNDEHVLVLVLHHVVGDGASFGILMRELDVLYAAAEQNRPSPLPRPRVHFGDVAAWQRTHDRLDEHLAYWREQLAGSGTLALPGDRRRRGAPSFQASCSAPLRLPPEAVQALRSLAKAHDATLYMVLLTGVTALLHRYSGDERISVGTADQGRETEGTEEVVGFFANTLVMRTDVGGDPSFATLLARVRTCAAAAYRHKTAPFERVVAEVSPRRDPTSNPLFQVFFVMQSLPQTRSLGSLRMEPIEMTEVPTAQFDLVVHAWEAGEAVEGLVIGSIDLFEPETVERIARHLAALLIAAAASPDTPVAQLELFGADERTVLEPEEGARQLATGWPVRILPPGMSAAGVGEPTRYAPPELPEDTGALRVVDVDGRLLPIGVPGRIVAYTADGRLQPTADRGRVLADGSIELADGPDRAWIDGHPVDLRAAERRLGGHAADAAVTVREGELLVLVVPRHAGEELAPAASAALGSVRGVVLPVTSIPRHDDGSLDEQRLQQLEVIDAETLRRARTAAPGWHVTAELGGEVTAAAQQLDTVSDSGPRPLPEADQQQVLHDWNDLREPDLEPLPRRLAARVAADPEATAVIDERGIRLGYRELDEQVGRLAARLVANGAGPGRIVLVQLERGADLVVALLAVLRCGAAYLPTDPDHPTERLAQIVGEATPVCTITSPGATAPAGAGTAVPVLPVPGEPVLEPLPGPGPAGPDDPAYLLFTSGSTGRPKGVLVSHGALANLLAAMAELFPLTAADRMLAVTTITFDIAALELFLPLREGACLALADTATVRDPAALGRLRRELGATIMQATPSLWRALLDIDPEAVRGLTALVGGEALPGVLAHRLANTAERAVNLYGPTEATVWATAMPLDPADTEAPPIGRPIRGMRAYVLDAAGAPVAIGEPGRLHLGGAGLAIGYLDRDELTAQRFLQTRFGRLYDTGDLASWTETGLLVFHGRTDDQVKIRGFRVELGEIESAIEAHPEVSQCAVVAVPGRRGEQRLLAAVVRRSGESDLERVESWRRVYDERYRQHRGGASDGVWISVFDQAPLPESDMADWRAGSVRRVVDLDPVRVLEIGAGSGAILRGVVQARGDQPGFEYWATDLSRPVVDELAATYAEDGRIRVLHRAAHQLDGLPSGYFDTIVLNSVVQYFPSADYLRTLMPRLGELLAPGGRIVVGDVRDARLASTLRLAVRVRQAAPGDEAAAVLRDSGREDELLLAPSFFAGLGFGSVETLLRHGVRANELTGYRYDAVLHRPEGEEPPASERRSLATPTLRWSEAGDDPAAWPKPGPAGLRISGIPNGRLAGDLGAIEVLEAGGTLAEALAAGPADATDPHRLVAAAAAQGLHARAAPGVQPRTFDLLVGEAAATPADCAGDEEANDPGAERFHARLREHLACRLPGYMVPSLIRSMRELPLTANGKIDRRRIAQRSEPADLAVAPSLHAYRTAERDLPRPKPVSDRYGRSVSISDHLIAELPLGADGRVDLVALPWLLEDEPETAASDSDDPMQVLLSIWGEVLSVATVGPDDDFFELGGHSLRLAEVVALVKERLGVDVGMRMVFDHPTVRGLIGVLGADADDAPKLRADAILDPGYALGAPTGDERAILLTGASGFLGSFLLDRLLRQTQVPLICPVRASSTTHAMQRLRETAAAYGLELPGLSERARALPADLAAPDLGLAAEDLAQLAAETRLILHNGADVNLIASYGALRGSNVTGTRTLLELAAAHGTAFHLVSTGGVLTGHPGGPHGEEEHAQLETAAAAGGYIASKWVAEQLALAAADRGLPVRIHRLGRVAGDSRSGACSTADALWLIVRAAIEVRALPRIDATLDLIPVDHVAAAIAGYSIDDLAQAGPDPKTLLTHLVNPASGHVDQLGARLRALGYRMEMLDRPAWVDRIMARVSSSRAAAGTSALLESAEAAGEGADLIGTRTAASLREHGLECPPVDDAMLDRYIGYFAATGFLPAATNRGNR